MRTLFLAWQDPVDRAWFPVGRLIHDGQAYQFAYIAGALKARECGAFQGLAAFPELNELYESRELFPLFSNRVPRPSRPEYGRFVQWLNIPVDEADPMALLSRSGGRRATDSLEVFPCPEPDEDGRYHIHFLLHGLRHLPDSAIERANRLLPGEPLLLMHDFQNPKDPEALMLRTGGEKDRDEHILGYCPRYLTTDLHGVWEKEGATLSVAVERLNPPPAPLHLKILCNLTAKWPIGFSPFSGDLYRPVCRDAKTARAA